MSTKKILGNLFRQNLSFFMNLRGLSQADLARMLKVSPTQAGRLANGPASPTLDTIEKVAIALRVPPFFLILHEIDSPETEQFVIDDYDADTLGLARDALFKTREAKYILGLEDREASLSKKIEKAKNYSSPSRGAGKTKNK